jgi:hypothetical protein
VGNPQEGFSLTRRGEEVADTINQRLKTPSVKTPVPREATKTRGKEEAIARYLRRSGTFGRWSQNPITFSISESELRSLLNATLETSKTVLRMNLEYYRENAKLVRAKDVVDFLDACRAQHKGILGER